MRFHFLSWLNQQVLHKDERACFLRFYQMYPEMQQHDCLRLLQTLLKRRAVASETENSRVVKENKLTVTYKLAINATTYTTLAAVLRAAEAVRGQSAAGDTFTPDLLDLGESLNEVTLMGEAALITGVLLMFATGQSAEQVLAIFNQN